MQSLALDAFGEIIEYLSIYDITSLASTSKHFQKITWPAVKKASVEVNNEHLNFLLSRNLTSIKRITLESPSKLADNIRIVSEVHPLTNLTTLQSLVIKHSLHDTNHELVNVCTTLTQLECIKWNHRIDRTDVATFFSHHKHLTELRLLFDASITHDWSALSQLRKFAMTGANFPYYNTRCNVRMLSNLTSLDISHSLFHTDDLDHFTCLTNLLDLRSKMNVIGPEILGKMTKLVSLDIRASDATNIDAISTQLTRLKITPDPAGKSFPKSSLLTNLRYLVLESGNTSTFQPTTFQFTDLKQLQKIRFSVRTLIGHIATADLTNLRELRLDRPRSNIFSLTKDEITSLCTLTTLQQLQVFSFKLDHRTFFQNVQKLTNLQSLIIDDPTSLPDSFKPEFVRFLQPLTRLTYLQISFLTPASAKKITLLTQLIELNVSTVSKSLLHSVKQFPFRVVYQEASTTF